MAQEREMTVREAGRRGGETVKEKYGSRLLFAHRQEGWRAVAEEKGPEFYSAIGKKGGETVKAKHGPEFYSEIGRKGGEAVKKSARARNTTLGSARRAARQSSVPSTGARNSNRASSARPTGSNVNRSRCRRRLRVKRPSPSVVALRALLHIVADLAWRLLDQRI